MKTRGVLYVATGEKYVRAAIRSALTIIKHCPDLPIHLFTDAQSNANLFAHNLSPFSSVAVIDNPHHRSKVDYIAHTPFEHTLFLDTDTALNTDIRDMFQILDRFDIALTHAHHRSPSRLQRWRVGLPDSFPEFNTGVILYRNSPAVMQCIGEWGRHFIEAALNENNDQTTLRELLWLSDLRIATLPPEYNVRFLKYPLLLWSKTEAQSKIFHLKALHMGWGPWFNRKIRATWLARKLGLGWLINLIKKILGPGRS